MAKGSGRAKRIVTHLPKANLSANTLHYTLQKTAPHTRKTKQEGHVDTRTAYARVVERETVTRAAIEQFLVERHHFLKAEVIHYLVDILLDAILYHLRAGKRVSFDEAFSFGVSFEGRIDPEHPFDARHLPIHPWVRFAEPFLNKLNTGVRIAYAEPILPPRVEVKEIRNLGILILRGEFRHPEALSADIILPTEEVIPCTITLDRSSKRSFQKTLNIVPERTIVNEPATLRLTWIDGGEETRILDLPIPPQPEL